MTEYARDLGNTGPGEVNGELGDCPQHLLCCDGGVDDMKVYNKGEYSKQEVASHHWGETDRARDRLSAG